MEAISLEEIEQMEDFIFHLSASQMMEWKANLKLNQPYIYEMFTKNIHTNKTTDELDFLFRMVFVTLKCFDAYGVKLPRFLDKDIGKADKRWKSLMMQGEGQIHYQNLMRVGDTVKQGLICKFIFDKFMQKDAPPNDSSLAKTQVKFNTLCVVVLLYGSKIEELLRYQNNAKRKE